jgi:hypothetical protein
LGIQLRDTKEDAMTKNPDPLDPDAHGEQAMEEAEEKMLLRHGENDEKSADEPTLNYGHDPDAAAEAAEKMLLRENRA